MASEFILSEVWAAERLHSFSSSPTAYLGLPLGFRVEFRTNFRTNVLLAAPGTPILLAVAVEVLPTKIGPAINAWGRRLGSLPSFSWHQILFQRPTACSLTGTSKTASTRTGSVLI
jgi:hypothetical protein